MLGATQQQVIGSKAPDIAQTTSILSGGPLHNHAGSYLKLPYFLLVKSTPPPTFTDSCVHPLLGHLATEVIQHKPSCFMRLIFRSMSSLFCLYMVSTDTPTRGRQRGREQKNRGPKTTRRRRGGKKKTQVDVVMVLVGTACGFPWNLCIQMRRNVFFFPTSWGVFTWAPFRSHEGK